MIKYHFFGKECAVDKTSIDHSKIKEYLSNQDFKASELVLVNQVHGSDVLVITNQSQIPEKLIDADAIVTNLKNLNIAILTADCAPILLFDEESEIIAATHAGWKGAFYGVIENTINKMVKIGAKIENIQTEIGPMIRQESYEIDQKFYDNFLQQDSENKQFFVPSQKLNHYLFDLPNYIKNKLKNKGIVNINDNKINTYKTSNGFLSYRRNSHLMLEDDGKRNVSIIQIN